MFKYNTSLEEKEMRSKNSNLSANASLTLKYLEIRSKSFSKEDLVNIGYYEQVIKCVCAYYNTITDKIVAYQNLLHLNSYRKWHQGFFESLQMKHPRPKNQAQNMMLLTKTCRCCTNPESRIVE